MAQEHVRDLIGGPERDLLEQMHTAEILAEVGRSIAVELDRERLVQAVADAATALSGAELGMFVYTVGDAAGGTLLRHAVSGPSAAELGDLPPAEVAALFRGAAQHAVAAEPPGGHPTPFGAPSARPPMRSYLMVPVVSRLSEVLGRLFFWHSEPGVFTRQRELIVSGVASWVSVALDNARLYESLQKASRVKDELLAVVSHELRTPLNAILGWSRVLRSRALQPEVLEQALDVIERNARAQAQLVEDLLDTSRIRSGTLQIRTRPVDLEAVIAFAVETVRPGAAAARIDLRVTPLPAPSALVAGDEVRLQQVFCNLLSNATKFTPPGGLVEIELRTPESWVEVIVRDTGPGIDPDLLPHIFESFRQGNSTTSRRHGGLGLGLAIVQQLVHAHGGTVRALNGDEGFGASFVVRLPAWRARDGTGDRRRPRRATETPVLEGTRVLVVDDNRSVRDLMGLVLRGHGAQVVTVESAAEVLEVLPDGGFDVLLADIGMPDEDGYTMIQAIRGLPAEEGGRIPAIAVTAYASVRDRDRALQAGFSAYLVKPVEPDDLVAAVAAWQGR